MYVHCFHCFHELTVAVQQALSDLARLDGDSDQAFQAGVRLGLWKLETLHPERRYVVCFIAISAAETSLLHMYEIKKRTTGQSYNPSGGSFLHHFGPPTRFSKDIGGIWRDGG